MGRLRHIIYWLIALLAVITVGSCNTNGCLENRSAVPLAGFYDMTTGKALTLDSVEITGIGAPDGVALSEAGTAISTIYLPMRPTYPTTSWQLAYKWQSLDYPSLCDTITFDYDSNPYFASAECGVIYSYHITRMEYTKHLIDSIAITDSLISNIDTERIKIFFRVNHDEPEEGGEE